MSEHIIFPSELGRRWLAALEGGHRLSAYKDSGGVWTIGAGVIRWPDGRRVKYGDMLQDIHAAEELFSTVLSPYVSDVDAATRDDLTQNEFDALVSLCYNIGPQMFRTSTALKRINAGMASASIAEAWAWFHYDNGHSVPGLLTRRKREIEVFQGGTYREQGGMVIEA